MAVNAVRKCVSACKSEWSRCVSASVAVKWVARNLVASVVSKCVSACKSEWSRCVSASAAVKRAVRNLVASANAVAAHVARVKNALIGVVVRGVPVAVGPKANVASRRNAEVAASGHNVVVVVRNRAKAVDVNSNAKVVVAKSRPVAGGNVLVAVAVVVPLVR